MMKDRFGREIDYLRVSVTDHCNFRCVYCMPEEGAPVCSKEEHLTDDELHLILKAAIQIGIRKVRFTGGEPLLVNQLAEHVQFVRSFPEIRDISLTTNGYLLAEKGPALKSAGLNRVNISLDTLNPDRFKAIARRGTFDKVWEGIMAALELGLGPVKLNCVSMKGVNDDELLEFARLSLRWPLHVRFIEIMPISWNLDSMEFKDPIQNSAPGLIQLKSRDKGMLSGQELSKMFVPSNILRRKIEAEFGELSHFEIETNGPARNFKIKDSLGSIGFISQISNDLCKNCNRLRLTSDGQLRPCLMSDGEADLRGLLRSGATKVELEEAIRQVINGKPERHYLAEGQQANSRTMSQIGG